MVLSRISTKALVISLIGIFSAISILLAAFVASEYKREAFDAGERILSRFISVTAVEAANNLDETLFELGSELQSDKSLRKLFKETIKSAVPVEQLSTLLNESFNRRYQTAGMINIQKIRAFDTNYQHLADSTQGKSGFDKSINSFIKTSYESKSKTERLKMSSYKWVESDEAHYSLIVPIGGFRLVGYLEIIVDPVFNLKKLQDPLNTPIKITSLSKRQVYISDTWENNQSTFILASYILKASNGDDFLKIEAAFDNTQLTNEMNWTRNVTMGISLIVTIVFLIFAIFFLQKTLFSPICKLLDEMDQVSQGNLLVNVDNYGTKEVFMLSNSLKNLIASLREKVKKIMSGSVELADSAATLSQAADCNKKGIDVQYEQTEQVATAMDEMNSTVAEVAKNMVESSQKATTSQQKSNEGENNIKDVISTIHNLSENILNSQHSIEQLSQQSSSIGGILDDISAISEQTNLLALNAAIEAARAGEAGRGFAVVADEVRTLANRTQESASDIRNRVVELQQGSTKAVESMNLSRATADSAVTQIGETGAVITDISESINELKDINIQVATAAEEQSAVADEINQNIHKIREVGDQNKSIAHQTFEDGKAILQLSNELKASVESFKV